jgi:FkbM family methyltransferase
MLQRARLARRRHPELEEISAYCFYGSRLRFGDLVFDIGANHGQHTVEMLRRGARVVAVEPQAKLAHELSARFPTATVVQVAVSDRPGRATLRTFAETDEWASIDPDILRMHPEGVTATPSEEVAVTTLDQLIDDFGEPVLAKIDAEGVDHLVLLGLSRAIRHILFEVHESLPLEAAAAFRRLEELGSYGYRVSVGPSWQFAGQQRADDILARLPIWGNVYAQRVSGTSNSSSQLRRGNRPSVNRGISDGHRHRHELPR